MLFVWQQLLKIDASEATSKEVTQSNQIWKWMLNKILLQLQKLQINCKSFYKAKPMDELFGSVGNQRQMVMYC
jgi:hypothetical protein